MQKTYFRSVQKANGNGQMINIPRDISKQLELNVRDVVVYIVKDNRIEIRKAIL